MSHIIHTVAGFYGVIVIFYSILLLYIIMYMRMNYTHHNIYSTSNKAATWNPSRRNVNF